MTFCQILNLFSFTKNNFLSFTKNNKVVDESRRESTSVSEFSYVLWVIFTVLLVNCHVSKLTVGEQKLSVKFSVSQLSVGELSWTLPSLDDSPILH